MDKWQKSKPEPQLNVICPVTRNSVFYWKDVQSEIQILSASSTAIH